MGLEEGNDVFCGKSDELSFEFLYHHWKSEFHELLAKSDLPTLETPVGKGGGGRSGSTLNDNAFEDVVMIA